MKELLFSGTSLKNIDFTNSNIEGIEVRLQDVQGAIFSVGQALELTKLLGIIVK